MDSEDFMLYSYLGQSGGVGDVGRWGTGGVGLSPRIRELHERNKSSICIIIAIFVNRSVAFFACSDTDKMKYFVMFPICANSQYNDFHKPGNATENILSKMLRRFSTCGLFANSMARSPMTRCEPPASSQHTQACPTNSRQFNMLTVSSPSYKSLHNIER